LLEDMSIESSLLVVAVVFIALYVLAALIFPERF
jgi:phage shock protein PspC (stress-responsive transcriptional regulator)